MTKKQKLELTWIGKENRPKLEPRILLEDPSKSFVAPYRVTEHDVFDNRLIHGDNLLALKALEREYTGKIQCAYLDPPFNTGQAFEHYDDGLEHSIWLSLIRDRLDLIHSLLSDSGTLFVHIDDNELGYLIVLLDEIFGRPNRVSITTFKQGSATGHKSINPGLVTTSNFVLVYAKNKTRWTPSRLFTARSERDKRYGQFITNRQSDYKDWKFSTLAKAFADHHGLAEKGIKKAFGDSFEQELNDFVINNANKVIRLAKPDYKAISGEARKYVDESLANSSKVFLLSRDSYSDMYFVGGQRILFYSDKLKLVDGQYVAGEPLTTIWDDLLSNNLHNEGGVDFPKGKKPEGLLKRCIELSTKSGDIVLDSFAGSGTTGAVAHKMGRRWIMIELGEHCHTHIIPRMQKVITGEDQSGISKSVDWKGGGGFRYYSLAPSLLEKDKWGQWVINREYNSSMLAEALCKLEGFTYAPSDSVYWLHGHSSETDYIYVTTQNLSADQLQQLSDEVGQDRTLLVLCNAFRGSQDRWPNLTVKKIPKHVLSRCEWGHDDYSLKVENLPQAPEEPQSTTPKSASKATKKSKQLTLDFGAD